MVGAASSSSLGKSTQSEGKMRKERELTRQWRGRHHPHE